MGKLVDHLNPVSLNAVNTIKARAGNMKHLTPETWDNICWHHFEDGLNAVNVAKALGFKHRKVEVEQSRRRFCIKYDIPIRGVSKKIQGKKKGETTKTECTQKGFLFRLSKFLESTSVYELYSDLNTEQLTAWHLFMETLRQEKDMGSYAVNTC